MVLKDKGAGEMTGTLSKGDERSGNVTQVFAIYSSDWHGNCYG